MSKLNLGVGREALPGWVNLDLQARPGVDVVWNLDDCPWPFADGEFEEIKAFDILEHVEDFTRTMDECWRVLEPGGVMNVRGPTAGGINHYADPTHRRGFTPHSFDYYCPGLQDGEPLLYGRGRWERVKYVWRGANIRFVLRRLP